MMLLEVNNLQSVALRGRSEQRLDQNNKVLHNIPPVSNWIFHFWTKPLSGLTASLFGEPEL